MKKQRERILILVALLLSGLLGFAFSWYQHFDLFPSSDVQTMQTFHSPAIFVKQLEGDPDAGRKIFKEFCAACHDKEPVIDVNAPAIGDKKAWAPRRKLGKEILLKITIDGLGAMPARGGCFECSDEQLGKAVQYILSH